MLETIITKILKDYQRQAGLSLDEDEDRLYLKHKDTVIACFSAYGATIESIQHEADQWLSESKSGIEFVEVTSPPRTKWEDPPPMMIDDGFGRMVPNNDWDIWHGGLMYACRSLSKVIDAMGYRCTKKLDEMVLEEIKGFEIGRAHV